MNIFVTEVLALGAGLVLFYLTRGLFLFVRHVARCHLHARRFQPVTRPATLGVDLRTNQWVAGEISDNTLYWRVFWNTFWGDPS